MQPAAVNFSWRFYLEPLAFRCAMQLANGTKNIEFITIVKLAIALDIQLRDFFVKD